MRILGEIRTLQFQGHDVTLTTYHHGNDLKDVKIKRIINIPWYKKLEAGPSWHKFYLDLILLIKTLRVCLKEKPDVIHGHLHEGALIGKAVSMFASGGKTPVVFDVQGSLTGELEAHGFFKRIGPLRLCLTLAEKLICRLSDFLVCSSESNRVFVKEKMNVPDRKVMLLPDGIYPDFFIHKARDKFRKKWGIPGGKKVVIYSGSLMKSKGIDYLIESIPLVLKDYGNVIFLIVGYPVEEERGKVQSLGVSGSVFFAGRVDYFDLPEYLAVADVAVDPKVDAAGEGSGKIINYMGAGLPVVCFDTLNNRAMLQDDGVLAKVGDKEDLSRKIIDLLRDEDLSRTIGRKNKEIVEEKFSWAGGGRRLSELYVRLKTREN